jgi:putative endonuclease
MPRHPSSRWLVYILRCRDGSLYTGITNDLEKRLQAHAAGKASKYTRSRLPVAIAHIDPQKSRSAALKREAAIKKLCRAEKERLIGIKTGRRKASRDSIFLATLKLLELIQQIWSPP